MIKTNIIFVRVCVLVIGDQTGDELNRDEWQGKGHILMYQAECWHDPLPAVSSRFPPDFPILLASTSLMLPVLSSPS